MLLSANSAQRSTDGDQEQAKASAGESPTGESGGKPGDRTVNGRMELGQIAAPKEESTSVPTVANFSAGEPPEEHSPGPIASPAERGARGCFT